MKTSELLKVSDINQLRTIGSYFEIKNSFEKELGNKLHVNGWDSLFNKIKVLKFIISSNRSKLENACLNEDFKESKKEVSDILKLNVSAKNWIELKKKVDSFIFLFSTNVFDPYAYYERTKLKKFKDSSRLEGIEIEISDEKSLASVLEKYRR